MKKMLAFLIVVVGLSSCSIAYKVNKYKTPSVSVANQKDIKIYKYLENGDVGEYKATIKNPKDSNFTIYGITDQYIMDMKNKSYNIIKYNGEYVYASRLDLDPECMIEIKNKYSNYIVLPKEKADIYWSRASKFVNKNATKKIQTQGDFTIETYNLGSNEVTGVTFVVTKEYLEGNKVKITFSSNNTMLEKYGCYYVETGEECN